jgi:predicted CXXCH cytochrome family protein
VTSRCEDCHPDVGTWKGLASVHAPVAADECTQCHQPHASRFAKMLDAKAPELCATCHEDRVKASLASGPAQHRDCAVCHQPHAGEGKALLAMKGGADLCLNCHDGLAKRLAQATVHPPVKNPGCGACHDIHAGQGASLLKMGQAELCATCHDPRTAAFASKHGGRNMAQANCAACHDPHAGGTSQLLSQGHPPFTDGECTSCHEGTAAKLGKGRADACGDCHDDKVVEGNHASKYQGCTACHQPHAGFEPALFPERTEQGTCTRCHDAAPFSKQNHHAEGGACHLCHDPHGAKDKFLVREGADLCIGCHETAADHTHPMGEGTTDPRTGKTLNCVSCHTVHSSDQLMLLAKEPRRELCLECHSSRGEPTVNPVGGKFH